MKLMYDNMVAETVDEENESCELSEKARTDLMTLEDYEAFRQPAKNSRRGKRREKKVSPTEDFFFTTFSGSMIEKRIEHLKRIDKECERCIEYMQESGICVPIEPLKRFYRAPIEHPANDCVAYLSSARSVFPMAHSLNVLYRKNQRKLLKRMALQEASTVSRIDKNQKSTTSSANEEMEGDSSLTPKKHFLPRVALLEDIPKEGRRKRRQIENAIPSPYWPQHLLDKLCLCMDKCHVGTDRKEIMFNLVKP